MFAPRPLAALSLLGLLVLTSPAIAAAEADPDAEAAAGAELHQSHCVNCHGTEVYTRENRMVGSLTGLESQVRRCETNLELRWFDEDIGRVATYLNHHFYHFGHTPNSH